MKTMPTDAQSDAAYAAVLRKKRKVVRLVMLGALGSAPFVVALAVHTLSANAAAAVIGCAGMVGFTAISIFLITYWKCPQCGEYFGRGQDGSHCAHCQARFDLDQKKA